MHTRVFFLLAVALILATGVTYGQKGEHAYGVYEYVVQSAEGSFEDVSSTLEAAAERAGWRRLAVLEAGAPDGCPHRARVFILYDAEYGRRLMEANRTTAPFALVDRINLFEDERGVHVAVVNPHAILRTVLMDDVAFEDLAESHLQALRTMITEAVPGEVSARDFGKIRKKGHIGKTMGVMAGGKFIDKIKDERVLVGEDWQGVADRVREGLRSPGPKWGLHLVYELPLPEYETVVFGVSGAPMEAKSFSIVKAGSDKSRKKFQCPGIAHAAAYPIEVVVTREGDRVKVRMVDAMFRMKMYFEDAGKWAFMKNMGMPGSLADEIRTLISPGSGTE